MMKTYTNYKASGVEWLGDIPEDWEIKSIKRFSVIKNGSTPSSHDISYWNGDIIWVTPSDLSKLKSHYLDNSERKITKKGLNSCGTHLVNKGSIVISTRAPIGTVTIANIECCTNQGCKSIVLKNQSPEFLYYLLSIATDSLNSLGKGTTFMELSNYDLGCYKVPFPKFSEQQTIANYLDKKTAQIARFIENKKKLIQLLEEEKKALITQAVTLGLDKSVRLKPSGVEWLGDIPEHWEVRKLKFISKVNLSNVDKKSVGGQKTTYLCNYVDVYYNKKITSQIEFMKATATEEQILKFKLVQGDVLITKDSESFDDIAVPSYVSESFENVVCGYHLAHIKPKYILGSFLCYSFLCEKMKWQFHISANGITRYGLGKYSIENALFLIPALPEQQAIVAHIEKQSQKIDEIISKYQKEIELIIEYRQRLIYDAVTGKIKLTEDA